MIDVKIFFDALKDLDITNFSGVPDSLLKNICSYISDNTSSKQHLISANEGSAVALAVGQYIATGKPSLVYMQNSGFGNTINPLLSLADPKVYSIPMILMVGWRGEPGITDEPQHIKQGEVMEQLLIACGIPFVIIDANTDNINDILKSLVDQAISNSQPVVLLVRKGTFKPYKLQNTLPNIAKESRENAINMVPIRNAERNLIRSDFIMYNIVFYKDRCQIEMMHKHEKI